MTTENNETQSDNGSAGLAVLRIYSDSEFNYSYILDRKQDQNEDLVQKE
jgi:hypothetical protein